MMSLRDMQSIQNNSEGRNLTKDFMRALNILTDKYGDGTEEQIRSLLEADNNNQVKYILNLLWPRLFPPVGCPGQVFSIPSHVYRQSETFTIIATQPYIKIGVCFQSNVGPVFYHQVPSDIATATFNVVGANPFTSSFDQNRLVSGDFTIKYAGRNDAGDGVIVQSLTYPNTASLPPSGVNTAQSLPTMSLTQDGFYVSETSVMEGCRVIHVPRDIKEYQYSNQATWLSDMGTSYPGVWYIHISGLSVGTTLHCSFVRYIEGLPRNNWTDLLHPTKKESIPMVTPKGEDLLNVVAKQDNLISSGEKVGNVKQIASVIQDQVKNSLNGGFSKGMESLGQNILGYLAKGALGMGAAALGNKLLPGMGMSGGAFKTFI